MIVAPRIDTAPLSFLVLFRIEPRRGEPYDVTHQRKAGSWRQSAQRGGAAPCSSFPTYNNLPRDSPSVRRLPSFISSSSSQSASPTHSIATADTNMPILYYNASFPATDSIPHWLDPFRAAIADENELVYELLAMVCMLVVTWGLDYLLRYFPINTSLHALLNGFLSVSPTRRLPYRTLQLFKPRPCPYIPVACPRLHPLLFCHESSPSLIAHLQLSRTKQLRTFVVSRLFLTAMTKARKRRRWRRLLLILSPAKPGRESPPLL